ncbi:acetate--CoA ligase family protein, partial [bacterium]|nr:acetate--CoA ligase family protein [bacterium]
MNIHEYQAKEILRRYGVATLRNIVANSPDEAKAAAQELGGNGPWVVKAQIHAGGRGKGGGVKLVKTPQEAHDFAKAIIGKPLVTHQTGPGGRIVHRVLVEEGCAIDRELYLGMVLDRATSRLAVIASAEGGVEIEEVAAKTPEKIFREPIEPVVGLQAFQARKLGAALGLPGGSLGKFAKFATGLYEAVLATDASMVEINPLVLTR